MVNKYSAMIICTLLSWQMTAMENPLDYCVTLYEKRADIYKKRKEQISLYQQLNEISLKEQKPKEQELLGKVVHLAIENQGLQTRDEERIEREVQPLLVKLTSHLVLKEALVVHAFAIAYLFKLHERLLKADYIPSQTLIQIFSSKTLTELIEQLKNYIDALNDNSFIVFRDVMTLTEQIMYAIDGNIQKIHRNILTYLKQRIISLEGDEAKEERQVQEIYARLLELADSWATNVVSFICPPLYAFKLAVDQKYDALYRALLFGKLSDVEIKKDYAKQLVMDLDLRKDIKRIINGIEQVIAINIIEQQEFKELLGHLESMYGLVDLKKKMQKRELQRKKELRKAALKGRIKN